MAFASLMACLHLDRSNAAVLGVVRDLADRFDAEVVGLAAKQATMRPSALGVGPSEPHDHELDKFKEWAGTAEQEFRDHFAGGRAVEWRAQLTFGPAYEFVAKEARSVDLVIAATQPHDHFLFPSGHADPGDLLMRLGRPLLSVPSRASGFAFGRAVVCWKDSREARRAVSDALPLLKAMRQVEVVEVVVAKRLDEASTSLGQLGSWLGRHGVEANCRAEICHGTEAEQLAGIADAISADLVVAGAFGHSRLREWAFGGVTSDLVLSADRCVLASH